jgi:alpha-N-acetylglucosaminidase
MNPSSNDPAYLAASNKAVYSAMINADIDAMFVMQGWLFHSSFWGPAEVQAYLSGVPDDSMLILDLNSDEDELWRQYDSYYGKPFAWCMLHNYGRFCFWIVL